MDEHTTQLITTCETFLQRSKAELREITADRRVVEWAKVNLHKYSALLTILQVPPTLQLSRDRFVKKYGILSKQLDRLENDIGNLRADFHLNSVPSTEAKGHAAALATGFHALTEDYQEFVADCQQLREAHTRIHASLNVETLLPLARSMSGKTPAFDLGYQLYCFVADQESSVVNGNTKSMSYYFSEANKLDGLLDNITLQGIPALAMTVIKERIKSARQAIVVIKDCLDIISENLAVEMNHLETIRGQLAQLTDYPLPKLLPTIEIETEALFKCVLRFHFKAYSMDKIYAIEELLELIRLLQRTIKTTLNEALKTETATSGSPLHTPTAAAAGADAFLHGAKGFWRGIMLLFSLILGRQGFNMVQFQETLREAIQSCDIFYGDSSTDVAALEKFIDTKLQAYERPFPHAELFGLMKKCLYDYGTAVEAFFRTVNVEIPTPPKGCTTVSLEKLIRQIRSNSEKLLK